MRECFQNNPFLDDEAEEDEDDGDAPPRPVCAEINDMAEDDQDLFQDPDKLHLKLDVTDDEEENDDEEEKDDEDEDSGEDGFLSPKKKKKQLKQYHVVSVVQLPLVYCFTMSSYTTKYFQDSSSALLVSVTEFWNQETRWPRPVF